MSSALIQDTNHIPPSRRLSHWIFLVFLALSLFVLYLKTMAPGLTWLHNGADGGDFIAAAATGGVAHPSGYPVYLLLARIFQLIPIGSVAYRTNLMSAVFTVLTAVFLYEIVVRVGAHLRLGGELAGMVAGYAYGISGLAWSQAIITEVYALHTFFIVFVIWLLVVSSVSSSTGDMKKYDWVIGLTVGLGMGNHLTMIFILPPALLTGTLLLGSPQTGRKWLVNWKSVVRRLEWVMFGLLIYIIVPWRASSGAPVNWGYAVNLKSFWWLVSGSLYQGLILSSPASLIIQRIQASAGMLLQQFGIAGLIIGFYYLIGVSSKPSLLGATGWVALINIIFALIYSSYDSSVYLLPFFLIFAIWIGIGTSYIMATLERKLNWSSISICAVLLIYFGAMAGMNYSHIDASHDRTAETFGQEVMARVPPDALVLTEGDRATFTLWYFQYVLKQRSDIIIVVGGLLPYPWYRDVLQQVYPLLSLPDDTSQLSYFALADANSNLPVCDVDAEEAPVILCP